jgi:hypothetical protein
MSALLSEPESQVGGVGLMAQKIRRMNQRRCKG